MLIRDRIVELRRVKGADLVPSAKNWRTHPPEQADALRGLLADIGFAGAALARELPDGRLQLIDGHLRAETVPDQPIPVLVLDVTEEEADKILATFDPVSAMAGADAGKLGDLLAGVESGNAAVAALLDSLAHQHGVGAEEAGGGEGGGEADGGVQDVKSQFQVLVILKSEAEQAKLLERLAGEGYEVRSLVS